jgi:hypothetical protein
VEFQIVSISLCLCRYSLLVSADDDNTEESAEAAAAFISVY